MMPETLHELAGRSTIAKKAKRNRPRLHLRIGLGGVQRAR
jgi:hypothetical protein